MSGERIDGKAIKEAGGRGDSIGEVYRRVDEVEEAAREWGVQPDQVEGRFIGAMLSAMKGMARTIESAEAMASAREERLVSLVAELNKRGESDLAKVEAIKKAAELCVVQAHEAIRDRQLTYDEAFKRQVQNIGNRMLDEFGSWRVIKQDAWNHRSRRKSALFFCMLTLLNFGAGYGIREWEDRGIIQAVARCRANPDVVVPATGEGGCFVRKLVPRDTADAARDLQRAVMGLWPVGS
jgi:hypothetical protein